ncbi:MAG: hypothetical protein E7319_08535 [Clostridiales bacterium]|nr:hypothetical protein [Clostridiales bacterium]
MPNATAYRRSPLVDPAYVVLPDNAVHVDGKVGERCQHVLEMVDLGRMTALDAVTASKLGGYAQMPPMPPVEEAAEHLMEDVGAFIRTLQAGMMIAAAARDKDGMLQVLGGMRVFMDALPHISEEELYLTGADALRLTVELYRRTGQHFLLSLLENLRSRLPDVSGLMHMFPFLREYRPETNINTADEKAYHERMERFATGKGAADALAMTALLAQYSGSGRDVAAAKMGMNALSRYHGMPCGAFAADPYLAGRDPARAVSLDALCAQMEACLDILCATGELAVAEKLEMLFVNGLCDLMNQRGVEELAPTNRLAEDDSCQTHKPETKEVSALLRALYAVRRSVWLARDDESVALMLPVSSGCVSRFGGVPVRLTAECTGVWKREIRIAVECKQPVRFNLQIRVPSYAEGAAVTVGGSTQEVVAGELCTLSRTYSDGDVITLGYTLSPRLERGYRNSVSVFCGSTLMAFPLPGEDIEWRYAVLEQACMTPDEQDGEPYVMLTACAAPAWKEKGGFILPPPQNIPMSDAYELTLIPYAGLGGRIAAFPSVANRG